MTVVAEVDQAAFWRATLTAGLAGATQQWQAYDFSTVPDVLPNLYAVIALSRRYGDDLRFSGGRRLVGYRLTITEVGQTENEARWVSDRCAAAIADRKFVIGGAETTFVRFEAANPAELDDGRYTANSSWTYAL